MTLDEFLCPEDPPDNPLERLSAGDFGELLLRWYELQPAHHQEAIADSLLELHQNDLKKELP